MQIGSRSFTSSISSVGVRKAITVLGNGFLAHPANTVLRQNLRSGALSTQNYYAQVLRFVYRLMVLFVAEERDLIFDPQAGEAARNHYLTRYSMARLRRLAQQRASTPRSNLYRDLWLVMEKLACDAGCPELGLASLSSLFFSSVTMPDLARCEITNRELLKSVLFMAFTTENAICRAIDYKNLGAEELGGIYESLLEMRPEVNIETATLELTFASGNARKTSGSYYTPGRLIDCLLDSALEPALAEACASGDPGRAILNLKVCDPACGSGLFLIAGAYRIAKRLAVARAGSEEPGPEYYRAALRDVVSHCIYGVDINPMAVELCRVNLWLEAIEPGKPLFGLAAHIQCGNSLLGATPVLMARGIPGSSLQHQFFHWHQAFSDVFRVPVDGEQPDNEQTGWSGGFDVVLGNPPYIFGENLHREVKQLFPAIFSLARGQYDTCWLFIEESLKLVNSQGRCALVVPDTLLARDETRYVRELLLQEGLERLYYCGTAFKANVSTIIFVVAKGSAAREVLCEEIDEVGAPVSYTCSKARFGADPKRRFLTHLSDEEALLLARVERVCTPLQNLVKISRGEEIGKKDVLAQGPVPILVGEDIARYYVRQPTRFLQTIKKDAGRYASPKIIMLKTGYKCIAALDMEGYVTMQSVYNLRITRTEIVYETLLALLNSRFAHWFVYKIFTSYKGLFPQLNQSTIQAIPVPLNIGSKQDELVKLVQEMVALKKATSSENFQSTQAEHVEREINRVIYALYGLSDAEITIIEQGVQ
jgi:type I restriction-modification system DNA methylase subunit